MQTGRVFRAALGLCALAFLAVGCGGSTSPPAEAGKSAAVQAPPPERPRMKPQAAQKLKEAMPHL